MSDFFIPGWFELTSVDNKPLMIKAASVDAYEQNIGSGCMVYLRGRSVCVKEPHEHITRLMQAAL